MNSMLPANLLSLQNNQSDAPPHIFENTQLLENDILSPVAGSLSLWNVEDGALVVEGQQIAVIGAMKMETPIKAPFSGILHHTLVTGSSVNFNMLIGTVQVQGTDNYSTEQKSRNA